MRWKYRQNGKRQKHKEILRQINRQKDGQTDKKLNEEKMRELNDIEEDN